MLPVRSVEGFGFILEGRHLGVDPAPRARVGDGGPGVSHRVDLVGSVLAVPFEDERLVRPCAVCRLQLGAREVQEPNVEVGQRASELRQALGDALSGLLA